MKTIEQSKNDNSQSSEKSTLMEKRDPRTKNFFLSPEKIGGPSDPLIQFRGVFNEIFNSESNNQRDIFVNTKRLSFKALGHYNDPELEIELAIFKFIMDLFMKFDIHDATNKNKSKL